MNNYRESESYGLVAVVIVCYFILILGIIGLNITYRFMSPRVLMLAVYSISIATLYVVGYLIKKTKRIYWISIISYKASLKMAEDKKEAIISHFSNTMTYGSIISFIVLLISSNLLKNLMIDMILFSIAISATSLISIIPLKRYMKIRK